MQRLKKRYSTSILFPRNSFRIALGSVFNIAGNYYKFNYSESAAEADMKAIENDWAVVGQDLFDTCEKYPANTMSFFNDTNPHPLSNHVRAAAARTVR